MGWETVRLSDIPVSFEVEKGGFEPVPRGTYTLQLLSASDSDRQVGGLNIQAAITDEGEFKGRRIFIDLPSPDSQPWAPEVLARLIAAMGASMPDNTNPTEELNRIAQNGHSRFTADVYIRDYTRNDGSTGKQNRVNFRSFRPAA